MGKFIDLTGQDFERLKVLSRDKSIKRNEAFWTCKCDYNNLKLITIPYTDYSKLSKEYLQERMKNA